MKEENGEEKKVVKLAKKEENENIVVTSRYFELMDGPLWNSVGATKFPNRKVQYRIARAFDAIRQKSKPYKEQKQKLIEEYAERKDGKIVRTQVHGGREIVNIVDMQKYNEEMEKLQEEKVDLGLWRIEADLDKDLPELSVEQMSFIDPFIIVKE